MSIKEWIDSKYRFCKDTSGVSIKTVLKLLALASWAVEARKRLEIMEEMIVNREMENNPKLQTTSKDLCAKYDVIEKEIEN